MGTLAAVRSGFLTSLLDLRMTLLFLLTLFTQIIRPETPLLGKSLYGLTVVDIELGWWGLSPLSSRRPPQSAASTASRTGYNASPGPS